MSVRRLAEIQPEGFEFTPENLVWLDARSPNIRRAARLPP